MLLFWLSQMPPKGPLLRQFHFLPSFPIPFHYFVFPPTHCYSFTLMHIYTHVLTHTCTQTHIHNSSISHVCTIMGTLCNSWPKADFVQQAHGSHTLPYMLHTPKHTFLRLLFLGGTFRLHITAPPFHRTKSWKIFMCTRTLEPNEKIHAWTRTGRFILIVQRRPSTKH